MGRPRHICTLNTAAFYLCRGNGIIPEMHLASDILFPPGIVLFCPLYLVCSSPGPSPFLSATSSERRKTNAMQKKCFPKNKTKKTKRKKKLKLNRLKWNCESRSSLGGSGCGMWLLSAGMWRYPCSDTSPANWRPTVLRRPKPCRCCVSTRRKHAVLLRVKKKKKKNL